MTSNPVADVQRRGMTGFVHWKTRNPYRRETRGTSNRRMAQVMKRNSKLFLLLLLFLLMLLLLQQLLLGVARLLLVVVLLLQLLGMNVVCSCSHSCCYRCQLTQYKSQINYRMSKWSQCCGRWLNIHTWIRPIIRHISLDTHCTASFYNAGSMDRN